MIDYLSYFHETQVVLQGGGSSERLLEITKNRFPKPRAYLGIKPRPLIDWILLSYVAAGKKEFYVTLWYKPETLIEHLDKVSKKTGIKFTYLIEPESKRLGRAGVIKYYLEKGVLSEERPLISANCSDIIRINLKELAKFQVEGIKKGFLGTIAGSPTEQSQFGRMICDPETGRVKSFQEKPVINLPKGVYVNTGLFYFDSKLLSYFYEIKEKELPVDIEKSSALQKMVSLGALRAFPYVYSLKDWLWLKTPKEYRMLKKVDLEKFLGISPVEKFLGEL